MNSTTTTEMTNFMGGTSFKLFNPLKRAELVAFSSFLGEPTYYQPVSQIEENKNKSLEYQNILEILKHHLLLPTDFGVSRNETFYNAINASFDFDFERTLELAVRCRTEFFMRKSTAQILAIGAAHPNRVEFNKSNPKKFREVLVKCWLLPSDATSCLDAWKALFGSKSKFPSFIKRAYEDRLRELSAYQQEKYRKDSISMVRLSHASKSVLRANDTLSTLMEQGHLDLDEKDIKWEKHRSMGKSWLETLEDMEWRMPHMAALRNIRGFGDSLPGLQNMTKYMEMVLSGVKGGKQFPFRYITAYEEMKKCFEQQEQRMQLIEDGEIVDDEPEWVLENGKWKSLNTEDNEQTKKKRKRRPIVVPLNYKDVIMEYLEKCLQASIENYPVLEGDVISLSDNSGSAHGTFTSSYGKKTVADIGNLSALFTAYRASGRGVVGVFGDDLKFYEVDKSKSLLEQYSEINALGGTVGGTTENGVWLFFKWAFQNPSEYKFDHWFCYSDMQVGHGGLYGEDIDIKQGFLWGSSKYNSVLYIDIHKCVDKYRMEINPKLNTYMVQTAGYDNTILPESTYRGAILSGWTGNEVVYAQKLCKLWDELETV
jgi:hypothetical protein